MQEKYKVKEEEKLFPYNREEVKVPGLILPLDNSADPPCHDTLKKI